MKKVFLAGLILALCGCASPQAQIDSEIMIPIYSSGGVNYTTATAEVMDLISTQAVRAEIGYLYAETLRCAVSGNLLSFSVQVNSLFKEGEVIAELDSSAMTYDYNNQKILMEAAYSRYLSSGGEANRLTYLIEQKKLELIEYQIDQYTIRAPYDCIIVSAERYKTGDPIEAGTEFVTVAPADEVYIYGTESTEMPLGAEVSVKLGGSDYYYGRVTACPSSAPASASRAIRSASVICLDEGEMDRLLLDVPNAVTAGWATIYHTTADKRGVLAVPDSAVKSTTTSTYCNLLSGGQRVQVEVQVGASIEGYTIILNGLTEGDTVII